ncbi:oxalate-binding protein [Lachnospiraceae bacterium]|jgi:mannose-6-phosphate isomerase-like protein (cupin superfamily)|nr:oxalate-binding protein [Lachnospiraceae bacterium]
MVIKASNMERQIRSELKGGKGNIHFLNCVNKDAIPNCRLLAFMTIPPNCSIGEHEHIKETECYIIQSGEGVIIDNGKEYRIASGDVVLTGNGDIHSVLNNGSEPLEIIAFIVMN